MRNAVGIGIIDSVFTQRTESIGNHFDERFSFDGYWSAAFKFAGQPEVFVTSLLTACLQDATGVANGGHEVLSFFNGNVPPDPRKGLQQRNLGRNAQTINERGVTIVPLDNRLLDRGEFYIFAQDLVLRNTGAQRSAKPWIA